MKICIQCGQLYERIPYNFDSYTFLCDRCQVLEGYKKGKYDWKSWGVILEEIKAWKREEHIKA